MAKYLVIVESPAKVKTIKKFLGKNYEVMASQGHVRDLPKSTLGFDAKSDFEPKYITIRGKGDLLASLRKEAKKADKIYLATDPDREGEAISWHLVQALNLDLKNTCRISFNEITKSAVKESLKNPRDIDMDLVDAQQARRMLDRMVGYKISPLLWVKVKRGLSAGRVQSAALRIIADREAEIDAFIPQEYYTLDALLNVEGVKHPLCASFFGDKSGKLEIQDKKSLDEIIKKCEKAKFEVSEIKKSTREKKSPLPFTTSTMQQEAAKALKFSIQKTMSVAQQLYEGVDVKGQGTIGLITYLRTDSIRVSDEAQAHAANFIKEFYGEGYSKKYVATGKKNASKVQDAHEAIRPANISLTPSDVKASLTRDQFRLYQLVWNRFMASQMANAIYDTTTVKVSANDYVFSASASTIAFDGFMHIYTEADDKKPEKDLILNKLSEGDVLSLDSFDEKQHFTQSAPHYTEASLVRALEELGIGRPSTYSPIITTLIKRHYVAKEGNNIFVTELGEVVNDIMKDSFTAIVDPDFTANMESLLDQVEDGKVEWKSIVRNFYPDLESAVKVAEKELEKVEIKAEETGEICEKCGRNMVIRYSSYGKFLGCSGFPDCSNIKPLLEKIGVPCPTCGKEVVAKKTKKGRKFYGCENNPECDFMSWSKPVAKACPNCGKYMVIKGNKTVCSDASCGYQEVTKAE